MKAARILWEMYRQLGRGIGLKPMCHQILLYQRDEAADSLPLATDNAVWQRSRLCTLYKVRASSSPSDGTLQSLCTLKCLLTLSLKLGRVPELELPSSSNVPHIRRPTAHTYRL